MIDNIGLGIAKKLGIFTGGRGKNGKVDPEKNPCGMVKKSDTGTKFKLIQNQEESISNNGDNTNYRKKQAGSDKDFRRKKAITELDQARNQREQSGADRSQAGAKENKVECPN